MVDAADMGSVLRTMIDRKRRTINMLKASATNGKDTSAGESAAGGEDIVH